MQYYEEVKKRLARHFIQSHFIQSHYHSLLGLYPSSIRNFRQSKESAPVQASNIIHMPNRPRIVMYAIVSRKYRAENFSKSETFQTSSVLLLEFILVETYSILCSIQRRKGIDFIS